MLHGRHEVLLAVDIGANNGVAVAASGGLMERPQLTGCAEQGVTTHLPTWLIDRASTKRSLVSRVREIT